MIPPHKHKQEENVDSWLMSYADMITLLLCFFVIFVAVSEPKRERLAALTKGIIDQFGAIETATPFQGVFRSLSEMVEQRRILQDVSIEKSISSLTVELSSLAFYKDKTADFMPEMLPVLEDLVHSLKKVEYLNYTIAIEGYTNDLPVTGYYPSNWELSAARAARLVRFFVEKGIKPESLSAVGFGSTHPKVPNIDLNGIPIAANRGANERVVIRLHRQE